ncbi:hypothetical protein BJ165DRAFT_1134693 [Panaeolus papilionaceus]|nr:hypothetical protein BJ165DRAFT_1134693 [Panaeolus papilionaceus]
MRDSKPDRRLTHSSMFQLASDARFLPVSFFPLASHQCEVTWIAVHPTVPYSALQIYHRRYVNFTSLQHGLDTRALIAYCLLLLQTLEKLMERTSENLRDSRISSSPPILLEEQFVLMTSKDISTIHHGLSTPVKPFTSPLRWGYNRTSDRVVRGEHQRARNARLHQRYVYHTRHRSGDGRDMHHC